MNRIPIVWAFFPLILLTQCVFGGDEVTITPSRPVTATPTPQIGVSLVTVAPPTTAVIQTTPTPLPTATPSPTPTPILYAIQAGDTLLGIALQRGTTVADIESLNPGIRPELLQIGQQIILPPPATAVSQAVAGTPVPIQIEVSKINAYRTPVGSLWVLGEVTNQGALPVENIRVEIGLTDEADRRVGATQSWVVSPVIQPGTSAPFGVLINEPPAAYKQPVVAVVGGQTAGDLGSRYLDVIVVETAMQTNQTHVQVSGQIRNSGQTAAGQITLVATFYDNERRVTGFHQITLDGELRPGETTSFTFDATPPGNQTTDVHFSVHALKELGD
jgi:LysM repeat protein